MDSINGIEPSEKTDNPVSTTTVPATSMTPNQAVVTKPIGGKKLFGRIGLVPALLIGAALLLGGSAAAYYGVIVPNKPENILKSALEKTALQKKAKVEGKLTYESTDPEAQIKAVNVIFTGQSDTDNNAFQGEFEVTASGVKLPVELRQIDKSIFLRLGDLSAIKSMVMAAAPAYAEIFDEINNRLAEQWIEIDETLLKQAGASCVLDTSLSLTAEDVDLIMRQYEEAPFATIKSTSDDTVSGRAAYKYELELDDSKGSEYLKTLDELSVVQNLKRCGGDDETFDSEEIIGSGTTPLTIWVDKETRTISKLATSTTEQSEEQDRLKGSLEMTLQYGEASITKPEGAKPAMEILGDLQTLLLGQLSTGLTQEEFNSLNEQDFSNFSLD